MSSDIPFVPATENMVKDVIGNLKTDQQKASHTKNEKSISKDPEKDMATSLDKSRSSSRTETEDAAIPETKLRSISSASLDDRNTNKRQPK